METKMKIEDVRRQNKDVITTIRMTKKVSEWLNKRNVSPTKLFNKAIEEIMTKEGGK